MERGKIPRPIKAPDIIASTARIIRPIVRQRHRNNMCKIRRDLIMETPLPEVATLSNGHSKMTSTMWSPWNARIFGKEDCKKFATRKQNPVKMLAASCTKICHQ